MSHQITRKTKTFLVVVCVLGTLLAGAIGSFAKADSTRNATREPEMFKRSWDYKVTPNLAIFPVIDSSAVYFVDNENKLLAIDSTSAARIWSSELGGEVASNLLLSDTSVLVATNSQSTEGGPAPKTYLRSISRGTGVTEWRIEIVSTGNVWIGLYSGSIVAIGEDGSMSGLSRSDGKPIWVRGLGAPITTAPLFGQKGIILGTESKEIFDVAILDGSSRKLWKSEHLPTALFTDNSGRLVVGDERGRVTAVSSTGKRSWIFRNGARISSVLLGDSDYLASSNDNFIYRLTRGGNVKWKRRLPGRLAQAPLILGDVAVMSVAGGGGVFVLEVDKGKILDRIATAEDQSFAIGGSTNDSKNFVIAGPSSISYFSRGNHIAK